MDVRRRYVGTSVEERHVAMLNGCRLPYAMVAVKRGLQIGELLDDTSQKPETAAR